MFTCHICNQRLVPPCGSVDFSGAKFSGSTVFFDFGAEFSGSTINFGGAEFSGGAVYFGAEFSGGTVGFSRAEFSGSTVDFGGDAIRSGIVGFTDEQAGGRRAGPVG